MENCNDKKECGGRREFLVRAGAGLGTIVLGLSGAASVAKADDPPADDLVIKLDANSPLSKSGGSQIVDSKAGKIIVVRTADSFVAFSAVCTHKGGIVKYDEASKQFVCPLHGSKFDAGTGAVTKGPAKTPLAGHAAQNSVSINLANKA
jgi:cytochrome b6-f complex iron-sulfur subunit